MIGLPNQLNFLVRAANTLGLQVNTNKTKVVIYILEGHLARHERWCLGEKQIDVVKNKYFRQCTFYQIISKRDFKKIEYAEQKGLS